MNIYESDILLQLTKQPFTNQRALAESCGYSLGVVNRSIKCLLQKGYLDERMQATQKAVPLICERTPRNAIILAAGFGMRMVPINTETPKGLLEVKGETLIERIIRQLLEVGITEIHVVVGFMKEAYEFLIDEYGVDLICNPDYAAKNNLHSLKLALPHLSNTYIIPCDIWSNRNPFCKNELYSWYMVNDLANNESTVRVNRKMELVTAKPGAGGNGMIGISYILEAEANAVRKQVEALSQDHRFDNTFWEEALYDGNRMIVQAKVVRASDVVEINTYEQLRELDSNSNQLNSQAINLISQVLQVNPTQISGLEVLKKGMTNRSFLFSCKGRKYIMRIPGEGTDQLISRKEEAAVYDAINGLGICDDITYISPENGYKITEFLPGARVCDPNRREDLVACMKKLRAFHDSALTVGHNFDIWKQIDFYESLWNGMESVYRDYDKTKGNVHRLQGFIEANVSKRVLTHIDAVPDNFLFYSGEDGKEEIRLIDWEYAGMQDPHVDVAMFCIYALYDQKQIDDLIDIYFEGACPETKRLKIYCYIAACGLLWSNWCEYKRSLGVDFGEYSLRQYRYAKEYSKIAWEGILSLENKE